MYLYQNLAEFSHFPFSFVRSYPHRLYKSYHYTDQVRDLAHRSRSSWVIDRIFALQDDESVRTSGRIQYWDLKILPDGSVLLSGADDSGWVFYFERFYADAPINQNLSFILRRNILQVRQVK